MKKALPFIIAALAVAIVVAVLVIVFMPMSQPFSPMQDENGSDPADKPAATDFTVYDTDKNAVTLSSMQGKPTVVNFWATWCGYCVIEMPDFELAYEHYKDDVNFMMVDLTSENETEEAARAFIAEKGYTFPVYFDKDRSAYAAYGLTSIPRTLIILADGTVFYEHVGAIDRITLTSKIEAAISSGSR